ncbi:hypothetical protein GALMADRAFT_134537 [Galerina marginata CBS 339.88]|uniref:Uncharacterized protein n=1 Tax=Galerina marginata (strain CBS 339.88) TaxID=685588 RepID=A0A067TIS1_GALM3|nr:hypothetical protein GALMADRAFT_134537 [Galerina marginata CBS 339.88]
MLLVLLSLISVVLPYAKTAATPENWTSLQELNLRAAEPDAQCTCPNTRTLAGVIWSCLATIFVCTWVTIHSNLPPPGEKKWRTIVRGFKSMFWGLIGPELTLTWSIRQWLSAREISREYKDRGWTMTHGFFLIMGGFVLVKGEEDLGTVSVELFKELKEEIEFPSLTREEIEDKSKGDHLTKGLVVIQVLWFIIQSIARGVLGLALTELELLTLAFASLNAAMYYFWWYKPLSVQVRVPIHLKPSSEFMHKRELQRTGGITDIDLVSRDIADVLEEISEIQHKNKPQLELPPWLPGLWISFRKRVKKFKRLILRQIDHVRMRIRQDLRDHNIAFVLLFKWPIAVPTSILFDFLQDMDDLMGSSDSKSIFVKPGSNRVPVFYSPSLSRPRTNLMVLLFGLYGTGFGALHCIAWDFQFPTNTEQRMWRILSLFITIAPLATSIIYCTAEGLGRSEDLEKFLDSEDTSISISNGILLLFVLPAATSMLLYIPARLILLFQAFFSLRKLPPGALIDIDWGDFLPHL